ncbi:hypothetical protein IFM89_031517 [Coptis chinensis]|uniref:DNA-binding protein BIN4 n=1 Tax=Coptis chinensis TaxID=261450 RepID=A0A835IHH9_9MAGN|nr:hypothetical protein IFM89_031517 [Coptis chinensis]
MSNSREASPDWLQSFQNFETPHLSSFCINLIALLIGIGRVFYFVEQAPTKAFLSLSSDSEPSPTNSFIGEDDISDNEEPVVEKTDKDQEKTILIHSGEDSPFSKPPKSNKSPKTKVKVETPKQKGDDVKEEAVKEDIPKKPVEPHVSSRLPLVMSEKVQRSKALVECEGESIDMSGDVGAVGRVVITDDLSGDPEMLLDLKGTIYKTTIVPSRTFCVVSFNQAEAKIEAVMNDFIQLKPISNVYEAETMIEGTLDGFSFDSEEETDKVPKRNARQSDQNNEADELNNGKSNGKAGKAVGTTRKKAKIAGDPPKRGKRKTQGPKKAKNARK